VQACDAIGEAHALGIVHRDLKPANLLLTSRANGTSCVKVLDFGISKSQRPDGYASSMTRTSAVMGSPHYMSPEQIRSAKYVGSSADIWSLGVVLHELLSYGALQRRHIGRALWRSSRAASSAPAHACLSRIVSCLGKRPGQRSPPWPSLRARSTTQAGAQPHKPAQRLLDRRTRSAW
jgi:serine/threonine protein kinase